MNNQIKTILLVEDEAVTSLVTSKTLQKLGYNVVTAHTGQNAVDTAINNKNINLILMDIDLGVGIDGTEAALIILQTNNIPVVFLSSHTEPEVVEKTEKITSYGYVVKNTGSTVLDASIKMAFKLFNAFEKIAESEEKYRSYVENAPDGVFVADEKGHYLEVNKAACAITGYNKEELTLLSIPDLLTEDSSHTGLSHFKTLLETGASKGEMQFKHKNGSKRWWSVDAVKLTEKRFLGFTKDISEHMQTEEDLHTHQIELKMQNDDFCIKLEELEASKEKYVDLYNSAPVIYLIVNEKGLILEANLAAVNQICSGVCELAGKPLSDFIIKEDQDTYYLYRKKILDTHNNQSCEVRISRTDGTIFPGYLNAASTKNDNGADVSHVVIINRSV